jgi:hypothetical protein
MITYMKNGKSEMMRKIHLLTTCQTAEYNRQARVIPSPMMTNEKEKEKTWKVKQRPLRTFLFVVKCNS